MARCDRKCSLLSSAKILACVGLKVLDSFRRRENNFCGSNGTWLILSNNWKKSYRHRNIMSFFLYGYKNSFV